MQYGEQLKQEVKETFNNFRSFLEFLDIERGLLLNAGLSEAAVDEVLGQLMRVRLQAASFRLDAQALLADLQLLADQTCAIRDQISQNVEEAEMICNIKRTGTFLLGATATLFDGAGLVIPLGVTQAVAGASMAGGSVLMGAAGVMPQC